MQGELDRYQQAALALAQRGMLTIFNVCTGTSSSSESFRADELTRLAAEAGQAEDVALGQGSLKQALALAEKYSSPKWELTFVYTSSLLLSWQHQTEVVVPVVRQIFPALMERPYDTVQQLLLVTWPELQVSRFVILACTRKVLECSSAHHVYKNLHHTHMHGKCSRI